MKHTTAIISCVVISILLSGCYCLHPLYTDDDLVFEAGLIGPWESEDANGDWIFKKLDESSYELTITQEYYSPEFFGEYGPGETKVLVAHLVKLDEYLFLDTFPYEPPARNDVYNTHIIPAHFIWKFEIDGDVMHLTAMDPEWISMMAGEEKIDIPYVHLLEDEERVILTASTQELQRFFLQYAGDEDAFYGGAEFHRKK